MRSIEGNKKDFGIYWSESFSIDDYVYGNIKIRIGDRLYPENNDSYDNYTLCTVFFNLKDSFINKYYYGGFTNEDFGETEFNAMKWHSRELPNVFLIDTTELGGYENINTLYLCMAYSGDTERLFYSVDNGDSFSEIRYPKGTIERVIYQLPTY